MLKKLISRFSKKEKVKTETILKLLRLWDSLDFETNQADDDMQFIIY